MLFILDIPVRDLNVGDALELEWAGEKVLALANANSIMLSFLPGSAAAESCLQAAGQKPDDDVAAMDVSLPTRQLELLGPFVGVALQKMGIDSNIIERCAAQ